MYKVSRPGLCWQTVLMWLNLNHSLGRSILRVRRGAYCRRPLRFGVVVGERRFDRSVSWRANSANDPGRRTLGPTEAIRTLSGTEVNLSRRSMAVDDLRPELTLSSESRGGGGCQNYTKHIDYAGPIHGQYILIFVDAYSKFLGGHYFNNLGVSQYGHLPRDLCQIRAPGHPRLRSRNTIYLENVRRILREGAMHPPSVHDQPPSIKWPGGDNGGQLAVFLHSYRYTTCLSTHNGMSPTE